MKYIPPAGMPYESGLTAETIYEATRTAFRRHTTKNIYNTIRGSGLPPFKLWHAEPIKRELEELVTDYLFGNLDGALKDLRQNLESVDGKYRMSSSYFTELFRNYGNLDIMKREVSADFARITKRHDLLAKEIDKIGGFNKPRLIKGAAQDSFNALTLALYAGMQLDLEELKLI